MTPLDVLILVGLAFLFLAAFNINFLRLASGWFGLALIYTATFWGKFTPLVFLIVLLIVLLVVVILLLSGRLSKTQ